MLRSLLFVLLVTGSAFAAGAVEPNQWILEGQTLGRGFDPTKHYVPGVVDDINTFNGNLMVTLPLGPRYTIRDGFSYGLTLTYNATHWDFDQVYHYDPQAPDDCMNVYGVGLPMLDANAGMGWKLTLGELYPPLFDLVEPPFRDLFTRNPNKSDQWLFVAPDGSKHYLGVSTIHPNGNGGAPIGNGVAYSSDGTFLRFHKTSSVTASVETPDGMTYVFDNFDPAADQNHGRWRLVRFFDRFSTVGGVSITYPDGERLWEIHDEHGRVHRVEFSEAPADAGPHYPRVVTRVTLAGFDGNGDSADALEYLFEYDLATVGRPLGHQADFPPWDGPADDVPLLTRLVLPGPGAGTPVPDRESYDFAYYAGYPDGLTHPQTLARVSGKLGWMRLPTGGEQGYEYQDYRYPNEARLGGGCGPFTPGTCGFRAAPTTTNVGVLRKTTWDPVRDPAGDPFANPTGEWFYQQELTDAGPTSGCLLRNYQDSRTFVFSPWSKGTGEGWVATVYYYAQHLAGQASTASGEDWSVEEAGLPFTKALSPAEGGAENPLFPGEGKLFLSRETWQCEPGPNGLDPSDFSGERDDLGGLGCTKMQAEYLRYSQDPWGRDTPTPIFFDENRRVVAQRTVTFTNGVAQSKVHTSHREWDGLGHFRTRVTAGNWNRSGTTFNETTPATWPTRVETTDFNPRAGNVDLGSPPLEIPHPEDPWLLNLHLGTSVQETVGVDRNSNNGATGNFIERLRTDACFDETTGALVGTRTRRQVTVMGAAGNAPDQPVADPAQSSSDVLAVFDYDPATGDLVGERLFGGDDAGLPTSTADACSFGGAAPAFERRHTYLDGIRQTTWVEDPCAGGQDVLRTLNRTGIEPRTGLITRSVSAAGLVTTADYDHRGRMTRLNLPGVSDPTIFQYIRYGGLNPTSPANVVIKQGDVSTPDGTEEKKVVDGFGRLVEELRALPGSGRAKRQLTYFAGGPLLQESTTFREGQAGGPPGNTRTDYDGLGRPFKITQPDDDPLGQRRQLGVDWLGVRRKTERFWVHDQQGATNPSGTANTSRVEVYDPFGRVVRVEEASGGSLTALERTDYHYGADGGLTMVVNPGNRARRFIRDGAGFVLWEENPEVAGRVSFRDFNALGLPGIREHRNGGTTVERLSFGYDRIGRPVRTRDDLADRPLSESTWQPGTGRLLSSKRHNWIPADPLMIGGPERDVVITQVFGYDALTGRVTEARLRSTTGASFVTSYRYDPRGNLTAVDYPECFAGAECAGVAPARQVSFSYDKNLLSGVFAERWAGGQWQNLGVVFPIQYHPNGLISSMSFPNGVSWTQDLGAEEMARPVRIRTSGAVGTAGGHSGDWDSGLIEYDLAGNLFQVGTDEYVYDGVSR
ncbi:MAG: RHS repeat protein, partial [Acidobacteria bacterium]|nr:RHS repeat protein [Acidobacteriota bacterium]